MWKQNKQVNGVFPSPESKPESPFSWKDGSVPESRSRDSHKRGSPQDVIPNPDEPARSSAVRAPQGFRPRPLWASAFPPAKIGCILLGSPDLWGSRLVFLLLQLLRCGLDTRSNQQADRTEGRSSTIRGRSSGKLDLIGFRGSRTVETSSSDPFRLQRFSQFLIRVSRSPHEEDTHGSFPVWR